MEKVVTNELLGAECDVLALEAVKLLLEKLAGDVRMFDVRGYTSVTDYYVNATGRSATHVASLAEDLSDNFSARGSAPLRIEGKRGNSWILVDFSQLIVNIFDKESRDFYSFDRLLPAECEKNTEEAVKFVDEKFKLNNNSEE